MGRSLLVSTGFVLALTLGSLSAQVAPHAELQDFQPFGEMVVVLEGTPNLESEIYRSEKAAAILIRSEKLGVPILLFPGSGSVAQVREVDILTRADGGMDLAAGTSSTLLGRFHLEGTEVVFGFRGKEVRLVEKPPLLGWKKSADLLEHNPEYAKQSDAYSIQPGVLQLLKNLSDGVEVKTYFGSWCPFCRSVVPFMIAVESALETSIPFSYYGLPRNIQSDAEAKRLGISAVPTGIVYLGGREVGRLQGNDWRDPALALYQILLKADVG